MSVVAEGVETFEELAYLLGATRIRCAQGYYFAKPMLIDQIRLSEERAVGPRATIAHSRNSDFRSPNLLRRA